MPLAATLAAEMPLAATFAAEMPLACKRRCQPVTTAVSSSTPARRLNRPPEVFVTSNPVGGVARNISEANKDLLAQLDLPRPESVKVKVEGGDMQMWMLKPPGFDPSKKWPLAYLVHGGPQGAWEDGWSYRWNPEAWAAQGYVVALPNPRGSTGFGQKFVEEISGDWGGKCFDDLMRGVEYLESLPYIDKNRMAAAGASFGGYMMDWFQGHTNKFKTLITHCGVCNFESMYATTEEILVRRVGARRPALGPEPRVVRKTLAAQVPPTGIQDADAHHPQRPGLPRPGQPGSAAIHDAAAAGGAEHASSTSRTKATGCSSRRTVPSGTRKCSPG